MGSLAVNLVATWPNERSAEGTVVLAPGDIVIPFKTYVRDPITLRISGGYIREISGGLDADLMRSYMQQYGDPEVYAVSHLGWGLDGRAQWSALGLMDRSQTNGNDARAFAGNFMFSTPRPEYRCRRQPQHALPSRHADARLHRLARWSSGDRRRQARR